MPCADTITAVQSGGEKSARWARVSQERGVRRSGWANRTAEFIPARSARRGSMGGGEQLAARELMGQWR